MNIFKTHLLLMAVGSMTEVTITPLTFEADLALVTKATPKNKKEPTPDVLHQLRLEAMTGLDEKELDSLSQPDLNTIENWVNVFTLSDSVMVAHLLGITLKDNESEETEWHIVDGMNPTLLVPLPDGKDSYQLKYPTGKTTKRFNAYDEARARTDYISVACTSLSEAQLLKLSVPDWTYLQRRLTDFLSQKADFFRS